MLRDFGATLLILGVLALLVGVGAFVYLSPCDPAVQKCLDKS